MVLTTKGKTRYACSCGTNLYYERDDGFMRCPSCYKPFGLAYHKLDCGLRRHDLILLGNRLIGTSKKIKDAMAQLGLDHDMFHDYKIANDLSAYIAVKRCPGCQNWYAGSEDACASCLSK